LSPLLLDKSSTIADILLLFTSAPISFWINSDEVSIAILLIFSAAPFCSSFISCSTLPISSSICLSRTSFLEPMSFNTFSLA